ncbi:IclR family transcriptional regulator [Bosea sp. LjRoot237]|uniref:IclR family transcriptional regulator n=1 Tax=Bosea sp. LjRoot237 TaxID=3342292 RepID=UPI003ECE2383
MASVTQTKNRFIDKSRNQADQNRMDDVTDAVDAETQHKNHSVYFVPGLHRGLRVLEIVAAAQRPLSITDIASELGLTRSSVFRLVYTLRHMGFLEEEQTKHFTLGPRVLNIGFAFLASKDIIEIARPELEALRDDTQVSAHLAIRDERDVLYLSCVQTRSGFLSNMNVGSRVPAYASPMGWLLLSGLPPAELTVLFRNETFVPLTDQTPTSVKALLDIVKQAGQRGYVISRGAMEASGSSISTPIINRRKEIVGAIDISGPDSAFNLGEIEGRYLSAVQATAARISQRMG